MKRNLSVFAILLSLLMPLVALAVAPQTAPRTATAPVAATAQQPSLLVNKVLSNGLEVIVLPDHSVPIVTVELAVRNGSMTEPPELNGLSHLYEHMFFKANRAVANQEEYLRTIGQLGIAYNGSTTTELVNYYFTTTSPNFQAAIRFMRDAARYPLFNQQEFERERQVVIGEIDRNESEPGYYLGREMNDRLFYKYQSRKNPLGNRQTVATATTDMMRLIQGRYYVPNNSALVITGDVNPDEVFRQAQELFGDWARTEDPFIKFPLVEHPTLPHSEGTFIKQPVQTTILYIGWQGPSIGRDNAATYAADVFSFILRQPNSRFQRALVDSGLVTGIDLSYLTQRNVGPITLGAQTTPEKARAALKAIYNEIAHFADPDYFTDDQLETAKALLAADDLYSREKLSDYTHTLSFWWASTGLDYFRGYQDNLRRTTRADIQRYVRTYLQNKPHVGLAMLSQDALQQSHLTENDLTGQASQTAHHSR